jgi:hypothetical protein
MSPSSNVVDPEAHHILPEGFQSLTARARGVFAKYGIDMGSEDSGLWLSHDVHRGTFGPRYTQWASDGIEQADAAGGKAGIMDFLSNARNMLNDLESAYRIRAFL